eukprot:7420993-Lingulodinium_polyedra.AAC.1
MRDELRELAVQKHREADVAFAEQILANIAVLVEADGPEANFRANFRPFAEATMGNTTAAGDF